MATEAKSIESRVAVLETHYQHLATKADLEKMGNKLVMWFAGIWIVSLGVYMAALIGLAAAILSRLP